MDTFENMQYENEIYFKLKDAEKQESLSSKRSSFKEVLDKLKQESSNFPFEGIKTLVNIRSEQILSA